MDPDNPRPLPPQCPAPLAEEPTPYWGWCTDGPWCGAFLAKRLSLVPIINLKTQQIAGVYAVDPVKRLWRWSGKSIAPNANA